LRIGPQTQSGDGGRHQLVRERGVPERPGHASKDAAVSVAAECPLCANSGQVGPRSNRRQRDEHLE
jgi:hypothetical protein